MRKSSAKLERWCCTSRPRGTPSYRRHKQSGQAVTTLTDPSGARRDVLLGKHGTAASRKEYARVLAEWEAAGQRLPAHSSPASKRCKISVSRVRRLAHAKKIESERRKVYKGIANKTHKQPVALYFVSMTSIREYSHVYAAEKSKAKTIADPVSAAEAQSLRGVTPGTVNRWIARGEIRHENLGHATNA